MNGIKITGDVDKLLKQYGANVKKEVQKAADTAAEAGARYLQAHSPRYRPQTYLTRTGKRVQMKKPKRERPGTYAKGWEADQLPQQELEVGDIIHGKKRHTYALAHILEEGHATGTGVKGHTRRRNGRSVRVKAYKRDRLTKVGPAKPVHHVQAAADYASDRFEKELERRLKNL